MSYFVYKIYHILVFQGKKNAMLQSLLAQVSHYNKMINSNHCHTPNMKDEVDKEKFIEAYNKVMDNKETLVEDTKTIVGMLTDTTEIDNKIQGLNTEMEETEVLVESLIHDNSKSSQSQKEYEKRYNELVEKFSKAKDKVKNSQKKGFQN